MSPLTGGCMCGAVRYECAAEPIISFNCHCRDCQRATGSGYVPAIVVPRSALKVAGEVKWFGVRGESGQTLHRGFCPTCGSRLFGKPDFKPALIAILAGSLDEPGLHKPAMDVFTRSAQCWDAMNPTLPKIEGAPPLAHA